MVLAVGGGVIGTAAVTSKIVAEEESSRVMQQIRAERRVDIANSLKNNFANYNLTRVVAAELDVMRMTEAISTHATVLVHSSEDLKQELDQLLSRKEKLEYTSTFSEEYWSAIKEVNKRNQVLTKTLVIPVVDHLRRTEIEIKGDKMIPRNTPMLQGDPHYFIIQKDSVMSHETDLFGKGSHVVGRICSASSSINATAATSTEAISESFRLEFLGGARSERNMRRKKRNYLNPPQCRVPSHSHRGDILCDSLGQVQLRGRTSPLGGHEIGAHVAS